MSTEGRTLSFAACCLLIAACGGGGGGGDEGPVLSLDRSAVAMTSDTRGDTTGQTITATLSSAPGSPIYGVIAYTNLGLQSAGFSLTSGTSGVVTLYSRAPDVLGPGTYNDTVTIKACYDPACASQVRGSPRVVPVTFTVSGPPRPGPAPAIPASAAPTDSGALVPTQTRALPANIVDAEYSKALDAVVFITSSPAALHILNPVTGSSRSINLGGAYTLSLGPDGLSANVGYGYTVASIDLTEVGTPGAASSEVVYSTTQPMGALVTDGFGRVHVFPSEDQWVDIFTVDTATGAVTTTAYNYEDMVARLHPSGNRIYGATNNLSPHDIYRFRDNAGTLGRTLDSPYHGAYDMCGDLWFSADGERIYTACGEVFSSSEFQSRDMYHLGKLPLYNVSFYNLHIAWIDDSEAADEIAVLEGPIPNFVSGCTTLHPCGSRLTLLGSGSLTAISSRSMPSGLLARKVFHSNDGSKRYIIAFATSGGAYSLLTY